MTDPAAHAKDRCDRFAIRASGMRRLPLAADRNDRLPGWLDKVAQSPECTQVPNAQTGRESLNMMWASTGSPYNVARIKWRCREFWRVSDDPGRAVENGLELVQPGLR